MGIICLLDTFDVFVSVILVLYLFLVSVSGIRLYHMLYQLRTSTRGLIHHVMMILGAITQITLD